MEELVKEYGMMALYMIAGFVMLAVLLLMYRGGGAISSIAENFLRGLAG